MLAEPTNAARAGAIVNAAALPGTYRSFGWLFWDDCRNGLFRTSD
jgi:hypothetical protein